MKRPTQADVARLAGVSTATVSYVLNDRTKGRIPISDETRLRVLEAIAELGYQPDARARSLRSGGTNIVGLLIPDMHNPHYWEIASGVEDRIREDGFEMLLASTSMDPQREIDTLRGLMRRRIDGLILVLSFYEQTENLIKQAARNRFAVVTLGYATPELDRVETGYAGATAQVMAHLFDLGHRRIGLIHGVGSPDLATNRLRVYQDSLAEHGLAVEDSLVIHCGRSMADGYRAALDLIDRSPPPSAIVCVNDLLAMGALRALHQRGLCVPQDISLASFDDIEMAAFLNPPLTTVRANAQEMGRAAAELALKRINQPRLPVQAACVEAQLIVRSSTGPRQ